MYTTYDSCIHELMHQGLDISDSFKKSIIILLKVFFLHFNFI